MRSWLFALLPGLSAVAYAQPAPTDISEAEQIFNKAEEHYKLQEYEKALEGYKEVYRLIQNPALLFNMGQCYRQLNRNEEAIKSYKAFLRDDPETDKRSQVEALIQDLQAKSTDPLDPIPPTPKTAKQLYFASGGLGVASLAFAAGGIGSALGSKRLAADPAVSNEDVLARSDRAKLLGLAADLTGLAAIGCAAGAFVLTRKSRATEASATLQLSPSQATISVRW
jgi:tetratricopeptide (TPR) repeat protein